MNRRTVYVDTTGVSAVDFGLGEEEKKHLFETGGRPRGGFWKRLCRSELAGGIPVG